MKPETTVDETFELVPLACGVHSLRSHANGQTFHPVVGPAAEARQLHVGGTRLVERLGGFATTGGEFVVWDVGLGAAANALAAVEVFAARDRPAADLRIVSFDRSDGALRFAMDNAAALVYPGPHTSLLESLRDNGRATLADVHGARLDWELRLEDFSTPPAGETPARLPAPHAVFYDPYSPAVNPEMWTLELFTSLRSRLRDDAPCLLTNYTRSTAVRVTMLLAGFFVGIGPSTGEKDETTVAANDLALLERPLPDEWLEKKVCASTNAAPLRACSVERPGPICHEDFTRLRRHPQFT